MGQRHLGGSFAYQWLHPRRRQAKSDPDRSDRLDPHSDRERRV